MAIYAENVIRAATASTTSTVSADAPTSPLEGDIWIERDTNNIYVFKDGQWTTPSLSTIEGGSA